MTDITGRKIYTVTLNPALDLLTEAENVSLGAVNRLHSRALVAGGKGINVSLILKELGIPSTALGFIAGSIGEAVVSELEEKGLGTDFIRLESGFTRINIKVNAQEETELNCDGPFVSERAREEFFEKLNHLPHDSFVVLAGSMPPGLSGDFYSQCAEILSSRGISFAADITGRALAEILKYRPYVIKPNIFELEDMTGRKADSREKLCRETSMLISEGAENVIVSLGADGCMFMNGLRKEKYYPAFKVDTVNTTACGDSMLAGFIAGKYMEMDEEKAMTLAVSCAAATAFSSGTGKKDEIKRIFSELTGGNDLL